MGVIMLSLKVVLFCSVAVVTLFPQEANAWRELTIRSYITRRIVVHIFHN
ncbi:hypothetical protein LSH36_1522g00015 [Paralvinella palmiformis]|uniref:Uncharacterized protein n=1 Tax=Paralvinella palmiformis TaxID=53620 RepID=A0AAD9MMU9_9ANNE|nr:hypothetical protein LSH36_1522g00015 [Paralvinella palmiformis]